MTAKKICILLIVTFCSSLFLISGCGEEQTEAPEAVQMQSESKPETAQSPSKQPVPQRETGEETAKNTGSPLKKAGLALTDIEELDTQKVKITLNENLSIYGIKEPSGQQDFIQWPVEKEDGRENNIIWFEEMNVKSALAEAISNRKTSSVANSDPLTVSKVSFNAYKSGQLRGFVDVTINGVLTINGAKIMQSDGGYWVGWPEHKVDGEYLPYVSAGDVLNKRVLKKLKKSEKLKQ